MRIMTIDKHPQILSDYVTMTAAQAYTEKDIILPINPGATISGKKVRVIEILKIFIDATLDTLAEDAYLFIQFTYKSEADVLTHSEMGRALAVFYRKTHFTTSGAILTDSPMVIDLTDGAGSGVLYAGAHIYCGMDTLGQGSAGSAAIKILYRYVDVPVEEYVGIAQQVMG